MSLIKAVGIDLAKLVFSIHGVDVNDKFKLRKTVKRNKLLAEVTKLPPCIIAMEACSSANHQGDSVIKLTKRPNVELLSDLLVIRESYCLTTGSPCSLTKRQKIVG